MNDSRATRQAAWREATAAVDIIDDGARSLSALAEGLVVCELTRADSVSVGGRDRAKFLQGLVSNDVALEPGAGCYAGFLTVKGKLWADLRISARADDFLVEAPEGMGLELVEKLDGYLFRDKVTLADTSAERIAILVAGDGLRAWLDGLGCTPLPPYHTQSVELAGAAVDLVGSELLGDRPAVIVWLALPDLGAVVSSLAARAETAFVSGEVLDLVRIEAGVPLFGVDLDAKTIPLEAKIDMISFTKGCYLGQEVIARVDARGAVNRHLVKLRIDGSAAVGDELVAGPESAKPGKVLGNITSLARRGGGTPAAGLGWVKRGFEAVGTKLLVAGHDDTRVEVA